MHGLGNMENIAKIYFPYENATNLILDYVRCMNMEYTIKSSFYIGLGWQTICGEPNKEFIKKVYIMDCQDDRKQSISVCDYFQCFIENSEYFNSDLYVAKSDNLFLGRHYYLLDPINRYNKDRPYLTQIDLIHMFATMDGTYKNNGGNVLFKDNESKDLVGWFGDLATFCKDVENNTQGKPGVLDKKYQRESWYEKNPVDFGEFIEMVDENGNPKSSVGTQDLIADIDAMNIVRVYLDYNDSISDSIGCYYNLVKEDNTDYMNRYKCFLITVMVPYENDYKNSDNPFKEFVYDMCGMLIRSKDLICYKVLCSKCNSEIHIQYAVNLFCDYISIMAENPVVDEG